MKNTLILLLFATPAFNALCQQVLENNPPSIKWYQVNSPNFNILFPHGFEQQAQRVANILEHLHEPAGKTLNSRPRKISVLLQNQSAFSNGFVSYLPRRSEFYIMPPQDYNFIGANDWLTMLAAHEYRHIVQYSQATRGINRLLFNLFGYQALAGMSQAAVPGWFWEGDAVATETAFTNTGRGKIPNFGLVFKTNLLEGRSFNYHKQYLRSYRHFVPNEYVLGYHLVSYLRKRTGDPLIWEKITARAWGNPIIPFTFSNAIHKETGLYVTQLYREMANDLTKEWQKELAGLTLTPYERVNPRKTKAFTNYLYPQPLEDGSVIAQKTGIGDIDQLVILREGEERKVYVQGVMNETGMLSAAGGKVLWNEYRFDPRWRVKNYSVIKSFGLDNRQKRLVSPTHSRYGGAALSPDGARVVTVQTDKQYQHRLVILDFSSGNVIKEIPNPANYFYSMPRWSNDGRVIVALRTGSKGKSVVTIDPETESMSELIPESDENIGYPVLHGNYLFYNSPFGGTDNIFVLDIPGNARYQVTVSRYGAYNPAISADGKTLYYNEQSRNGMDVVKVPLDASTWKQLTPETNSSVVEGLAKTVEEQEAHPHLFNDVPGNAYAVTKYSKVKGLINPYSWGLYVDQNDLSQATFGLTSRDILSTLAVSGGYRYDIFEQTGDWYGTASYQGFYPVIDVGINYGHRETETGVFGRDVTFNWTETGISGGIRVPLLLTRSKYLSQLEIGNSVGLTLTSSFETEVTNNGTLVIRDNDRYVPANDTLNFLFTNRTDYGQLVSNRFAVSYSHMLKRSYRDIYPRFGQFLNFEHYSTPFGGDYYGWLWAVRGVVYFPGLLKHQSLYFTGGYQRAYNSYQFNTYSFRNRIFKPRGYGYPVDQEFYTISANYAMPLWYPDISIGPLLNIQRVKCELFADYGEGRGTDYFVSDRGIAYFRSGIVEYQSAGVELTFDVNFFRLQPQFEVGFRTTYRAANVSNNAGVVFEILIGNIPL